MPVFCLLKKSLWISALDSKIGCSLNIYSTSMCWLSSRLRKSFQLLHLEIPVNSSLKFHLLYRIFPHPHRDFPILLGKKHTSAYLLSLNNSNTSPTKNLLCLFVSPSQEQGRAGATILILPYSFLYYQQNPCQ